MQSRNIVFIGDTINELWNGVVEYLKDMASCPDTSIESRDGEVAAEVINATLELNDPTRNILTNSIRKLPMRYLIGEMLWYMSGNPELKGIQKYTSAWNRMSDDGKTVNSNYGHIINNKYGFDQYEYCKELLKKDPNSRQAVIHIKEASNTIQNPTKDLNCTVSLQFMIRPIVKGKEKFYALFMTTYMRSNDIWLGTPNDIFQFTCIQIRMAMELGLEVGTYTHYVGSLHLYKRDYDTYLARSSAEVKADM